MKTNPPFHAEHIGSLLRPRELKQAYRAFNEGRLSAEAFRQVQDQCVRNVVTLQEELGLQAITDGEFRRASYWAHFVEAVEGLTVKPALFVFRDESSHRQEFLAPHVSGQLRRSRSISGDEFTFLKSVTRRTPKLTLPSPPTMHFWRGWQGVDRSAYPDMEAFFEDLARLYREEIAELAALGARYIQIDEVPLAMLCDPTVREAVKQGGEDPESLIARYINLINAALTSRPEGMVLGLHLCRGNFKGKWLSEGGYEAIAECLFNQINVDAFFLEFDTPRAGDFAPLKYVPRGKMIILGLVSTKTPALESVDDLLRRINEASRFVSLERLAISPQCGFASTVAGNPITFDDQVNKLRLVVDVARRVWGEL